MTDLPDGIVVERTPMRDLAHQLLSVLHSARIVAWMAPRPGAEIGAGGACLLATAWDVTVSDREAERARRVIAGARRRRAIRV